MNTKTNLFLDFTIFTAFLVAYNPRSTGVPIHEWLSLAFAMAVITHLLLHWKWIVRISKDFFKKLFHQSRLNYVLDIFFFVAVTATIFSGLMISESILPTLGIQLDVSRGWRSVHSLAANASLILLGSHLAMHLKWVLVTIGRTIVNPILNLFRHRPVTQTLAAQTQQVEKSK